MAGTNAYVAGFKCPNDTISFGSAIGAAPTGTAEDNDTFVTTTTGDATGVPTGVWKFDKDTGTWVSVVIDTDTDVSAINAALAGTDLTMTITEDGNTLTSTADLSALLDDTDISAVDLAFAGGTLTMSVTEDGVTLTDAVALESDTDVSATRILEGPNSTDAEPTIQFGVTEDGVEVLSNEWPLPPICPAEMTRAAAIALRNAGGLIPGCHYIITNPNANGTLGLQKVLMHAVDANTLSGCYLKVSHDNTAWNGSYDIDVDDVEHVHDHQNDNTVTTNTSIITFPFGNTAVTDNVVYGGRLVYTAGTVRGATIKNLSTLNMIAGSVTEISIDGDSDVTIRSGSHYDIDVHGGSSINQVGTGFMRNLRVSIESNITVGNVNMQDNEFTRSSLNTTGSVGNMRYNRISRSTLVMDNIPNVAFDSNDMSANSEVRATGAARISVNYLVAAGFGRVLVSSGGTLLSNYSGLRDYSYIQVLQGTLTVNYSSLASVGYIQHNSTGANNVDRANVTTNSRIRFLGTSTACRVYYTNVSSGSIVEHRGTSTGCYFYYCDVSSSSTMYTNNSVNLRGYYNAISGNSEYSSQNVTGTHYAYYNVMAAHGYLRHRDATGGRFYAIHCSAQAILQMTGVNANCYYSSFTAYYYLYLTAANISGTKYALHGSGRRSYTPTVQIANGTFTQNF